MIKAAILDWNGVIVDDLDAIARANRDVIKILGGKEITIETWYGEIQQDWKTFFIKYGVREEDIEKVLPLMDEIYPRYAEHVHLVEGVKEVLAYMKEMNIKMGVLSGSSKQMILDNIETFSLQDNFDFIVSGDDVQHQKPHAEPLEKAIKMTGVAGNEIIYIDDMSVIFEQAKKLGLVTVALKSRVSGEFQDADYEIENITDVKAIMKEIG